VSDRPLITVPFDDVTGKVILRERLFTGTVDWPDGRSVGVSVDVASVGTAVYFDLAGKQYRVSLTELLAEVVKAVANVP